MTIDGIFHEMMKETIKYYWGSPLTMEISIFILWMEKLSCTSWQLLGNYETVEIMGLEWDKPFTSWCRNFATIHSIVMGQNLPRYPFSSWLMDVDSPIYGSFLGNLTHPHIQVTWNFAEVFLGCFSQKHLQ